MIKNSLFFLLLTFFLAGCAENGSIIELSSVQQTMVENNTSTNETKQINSTDTDTKMIDIENTEERTIFSDSTMNTISGVVVVIIGIMILL